MNNLNKVSQLVYQNIIAILLFVFPVFFLPLTRDFIIFSKYYFLALIVFVLLFISFGKFILTRKITWTHNIATQSLILILLSYALSIVLMSPNKFQAIFNPQFGFIAIASLIILYFYGSTLFSKTKTIPVLMGVSAFFVSAIAIVIMLDPFKMIKLPVYWSFLLNTTFNTIGSSVHFIAYLIFVLVGLMLYIGRRYRETPIVDNNNRIIYIVSGIIALFITLAAIFHVFIVSQQLIGQGGRLIIPPMSLSWFAAVEVLKNPMTAVFGVGVDNFTSIFTQVRTINYNLSPLWQINAFNTSGSSILHILTETGILGLIGFSMLISTFMKHLKNVKTETAGMFIVAVIFLFILPPSLMMFFIFFVSIALMNADIHRQKANDIYEINLSNLTPIYIGTIVVFSLVLGGTVYFFGRNFLSDYYFKRSMDAVFENDLKKLYDNQNMAIRFAYENEEFHRQFAQTNLLIANNIAAARGKDINEQDKQTISQAIQASIVEAKTAVTLNPQKVTNWQSLAGVYNQLINAAENAPDWAVYAYQQSLALDPRNPLIRLDLGGIYYLLKNYDQAQILFEQAVSLKPDWANAHYNLAWAYYQKKFYGSAVDQMQIVVGLIDPATASADYKNAQKNLEDFKKIYQEELEKITKQQAEQEAANKNVQSQAEIQQLNLPTPPPAQLDDKIQLPEEASPQENPNP